MRVQPRDGQTCWNTLLVYEHTISWTVQNKCILEIHVTLLWVAGDEGGRSVKLTTRFVALWLRGAPTPCPHSADRLEISLNWLCRYLSFPVSTKGLARTWAKKGLNIWLWKFSDSCTTTGLTETWRHQRGVWIVISFLGPALNKRVCRLLGSYHINQNDIFIKISGCTQIPLAENLTGFVTQTKTKCRRH